ncbi:hypothetical protein DL89DRAFT_268037 [Linderina pennispora]|uniref:Uncharacterized protein n=1 Tax=Linderina pennispora TaxID=61395 RepID=A0A1Y1W6Z0_9FUNG|nr:uncharacterized protein DL89DRAFT_268037 [Linderina pennispora]ORX68996.1 hypothetical protein DL89DRAFT_268037 [Linderina pennispora]
MRFIPVLSGLAALCSAAYITPQTLSGEQYMCLRRHWPANTDRILEVVKISIATYPNEAPLLDDMLDEDGKLTSYPSKDQLERLVAWIGINKGILPTISACV